MHDVYLIGKSETCDNELDSYLNIEFDYFKKDYADDETLAEVAARRCYRSFKPGLNPNVTQVREDPKEFWLNILKSGHGSVLEHIQATFAFEGVSRVFTHELVRHRVGIAISQESMRYVRFEDFEAWVPLEITGNEKAYDVWVNTILFLKRQQKDLQKCYAWDLLNFSAKKKITSALRRLLPIGIATGMIWSANLRMLRHIIRLRTSLAAEVEMRIVFDKVADICRDTWPNIFQDFIREPNGEWISEYST